MQIHLKFRTVADIIPPVIKVQEAQLTQRNQPRDATTRGIKKYNMGNFHVTNL